jgi:hypothetical protein
MRGHGGNRNRYSVKKETNKPKATRPLVFEPAFVRRL